MITIWIQHSVTLFTEVYNQFTSVTSSIWHFSYCCCFPLLLFLCYCCFSAVCTTKITVPAQLKLKTQQGKASSKPMQREASSRGTLREESAASTMLGPRLNGLDGTGGVAPCTRPRLAPPPRRLGSVTPWTGQRLAPPLHGYAARALIVQRLLFTAGVANPREIQERLADDGGDGVRRERWVASDWADGPHL